jgi:conjugative relaxase-like TrwC/TraI family protein
MLEKCISEAFPMISHQALNARGENKKGECVVDYLITTEVFKSDYYHGEEIAMMKYGGKGAHALGLMGQDVLKEHMLSLAAGFNPFTNEALCQNAGEEPKRTIKKDKYGTEREVWEGGHRVGFDFTFTPRKDVSILFGLGNSEQKMDALESHRAAVAKAMSYLESKVETRLGKGGKDVVGVGGLVYSQHTHTSNRNLEPNLHDHVLIYGIAQRQDGSWGTYDAKELYRHTRAADVIYQNELACNLRDKGYAIQQIEETQKNGEVVRRFGIQGIGDDLCKAFSTRREEILEYQKKHGGTAQAACLATRKHKEEPSQQEQRSMWEEVARRLGPEAGDLSRLKEHGQDKKLSPTHVNDLLDQLHESESIVCQHDLVKLIGNEHMGFMRTEQIFSAVEDFKQNLHVVQAKALHRDDKGKTLAREYSEERYQSQAMRDMERGIVEGAKRRERETHLTLRPESTAKAIKDYETLKGFVLSQEQANAVEHVTNRTAAVALLEGFAGTGKTTVSQVIKRAFEEEGYSLIGVAISNKAAMKLEEESGMPSTSVTKTLSMLDKGKLTLTNKHVMVIDEAGMLDTRNTAKIMNYAEKAGAKVILQGDESQLQPIQAGSGFTLAKGTIGAERLTEIRRQETDDMRATALSFYSLGEDVGPMSRAEQVRKGKRIMENLEDDVVSCNTHMEATKLCVKDFIADPLPMEKKLLIAHTRDDIGDLTAQIRERLRDKGMISGHDHAMKCKDNKAWVERGFAEGDRIRFKARDMALGVVNGTEGVITSIKRNHFDDGLDFVIQAEGNELRFSSYEYNALDHNYAVTVHASQGQGKDHVYHLYNQSMADNQSMLVGYTRAKAQYRIYGQVDEIESAHMRAGQDRKKENALTPESDQMIQVLEGLRRSKQSLH